MPSAMSGKSDISPTKFGADEENDFEDFGALKVKNKINSEEQVHEDTAQPVPKPK